MPANPSKLFQFWQELKRRKVVRVIAMYAGAAYIILEVVSNVTDPLRLPGWTATLVVILLAIGFPVVAILSWIFDYTPEGYVKTGPVEEKPDETSGKKDTSRRFRLSDAVIIVLFIAVCILAWPRIFGERSEIETDPDGRISISVIPFKNLTTDTLYNIWQEGIQHILINSLSNSSYLAVRQPESMHYAITGSGYENYASITPGIGGELAQKLETNTFIYGQLIGAGSNIRINVQLRDAVSDEIYQSYELSGRNENDIPILADSLSVILRNYLEIEVLKKEVDYEISRYHTTNSSEAYRNYIMGMRLFWKTEHTDAIYYFRNAIELDSNFLYARIFLGWSYGWMQRFQERKEVFYKLNKNLDNYSSLVKAQVQFPKNWIDKEMEKGIRNLKIQLDYDPKQRVVWFQSGSCYEALEMYEEAAEAYERSLKIDREWGGGWEFYSVYYHLGEMYHKLGNHEREEEIYQLGFKAEPEEPHLIFRQAVCAFSHDDTIKGSRLLQSMKEALLKDNRSDAYIDFYSGMAYDEAGQDKRAMQFYQQVIESGRDEYLMMSAMLQLSFILIRHDTDIAGGISMANWVLEMEPDEVVLISDACYAIGLGYYKLKKYSKALDYLRQAWDLLPGGYNQELNLLIRELQE